ncbi:hypothetical protein ALP89_05268 [Pseudomonas syringae pv. persicae]|nr:hypothetical protein ALP89_05268 [Pseudomonas syringae pv. persicae]
MIFVMRGVIHRLKYRLREQVRSTPCGQKAENTVFRVFQDLYVTLGASDSGAGNCARPASRDKNARNMSD